MQYKSATGIDYVSAATPLPVTLSGTIPATITDDTTTNATMYPTWVTAASGNLPIKVSSTKLTFNPSTGLLSIVAAAATGSISAVNGFRATGAVQTNLTSSISMDYATGSGRLLIMGADDTVGNFVLRLQEGDGANAISPFKVSNTGVPNLCASTATPAAGSAAAFVLLGTTAGFGIYYGSGAPTVTAAQGSLYIRSDGSSSSTRLYVNSDGGTTWVNFTSAS